MLKIQAHKQEYLEEKQDTQLKNTKIVPNKGDNQLLHDHYGECVDLLELWCKEIAKVISVDVEDIRRLNFKYHPFKKKLQKQMFEYGRFKRLKHQQGGYYTIGEIIEMLKDKAGSVLVRGTDELEHFTVGMYNRTNKALDWIEEYDRKYNGGDRHGAPGRFSEDIKSMKVKIKWLK